MAWSATTEKPKIDDLFRALCELYLQQRMPVVACPLPFPLLQVAEARVWRGSPPPNEADFYNALANLARCGLPARETEAIVAITECLFRLMRPVELEIEARLPDLFSKLGERNTFAPDPDDALVRAEFFRWWKAIEAETSEGWMLAVTRRPVWVAGRPNVFAHEICAATVAERLTLEGVLARAAHSAAAELAAVLSDRPVHGDEARRWWEQYRAVRVLQLPDQPSLTRHLAYPRDQLSATGIQWSEETAILRGPWLTPGDLLEHWRLPIATAAQVARIISRGPYRKGRQHASDLAACLMCDTDEMAGASIWAHLRDRHNVADIDFDSSTISEIHHRRTRQVLARLRKGPPSATPLARRPPRTVDTHKRAGSKTN